MGVWGQGIYYLLYTYSVPDALIRSKSRSRREKEEKKKEREDEKDDGRGNKPQLILIKL